MRSWSRHAIAASIPLAWALLLSAGWFQPARGQDADRPGPGAAAEALLAQVGYFISADSSRAERVGGEEVIYLVGDVVIRHATIELRSPRATSYRGRRITYFTGGLSVDDGPMHLEGDRGEYDQNLGIATVVGNVRIEDPQGIILADKVVYNRASGRADLTGNVVLQDSLQTLNADSLVYWREDGYAEAFGNVEILDRGRDLKITGDHGTYDRAIALGIVDENPILITDAETPEPTYIEGRIMRVDMEKSVGEAVGDVVMKRGDTWAYCDSAILFNEEEKAVMLGDPRAVQGDMEMRGDRMTVHYSGDSVKRIELEQNTEIRWTRAPAGEVARTSTIHGDLMKIYMENDELDSVVVAGTASSLYYPEDTGLDYRVAFNETSGDTLSFAFENQELIRAHIKGGARGTYHYYDLKEGETADSLLAGADTTLRYVDFDELKTTVDYEATTIHYYSAKEDILLRGKSKVEYEGRTLEADDIDYNAVLELLQATGEPVLKDRSDTVYGNRMDYDMDTRVGRIAGGSTRYNDGFYSGESITKVGENQLRVHKSVYTTCDLQTPHYHFSSNKMKVYIDDKVMSGPITLYIGNVPVFYLPFMAANLKRGRQSGLLKPDFEFGITSSGDRFLRNLGYYWATNDYTDFIFIGNFNENRNFNFRLINKYKKRYDFNGSVRLDLVRDLTDFTNRWEFRAQHIQEVLPYGFRGRADMHFVSDDQVRRDVNQIDEVERYVDRNIQSNASITGRLPFASTSLSWSRRQNLEVTQPNSLILDETLPSLNFSFTRKSLWPGGSKRGGDKGGLEGVLSNIFWTPSMGGSRRFTRTLRLNAADSTTFEEGKMEHRANGRLGVSSSQPLYFLSLQENLNFNYTYFWTDRATANQPVRRSDLTWNAGATASSKIYGFFFPRVAGLEGIRHVITPAVSFSYRPQIRDIQQEGQSFTWNLQNKFDLKVRNSEYVPPEDTESGEAEGEEFKKVNDFILWTLNGSYDPKAPAGRNWSNISSYLRSTIWKIGLELRNTYDPNEGRVERTSVSSSLSLSGQFSYGVSFQKDERERVAAAQDVEGRVIADTSAAYIDSLRAVLGPDGYILSEEEVLRRAEERKAEGEDIEKGLLPWSLRLSAEYSKLRNLDPSSNLYINAAVDLTPGWKVSYDTAYDVFGQVFQYHRIAIIRDLHCWSASFNTSTLGNDSIFYFRINLNAHSGEVFYERGDRGASSAGRYVPF